MRAQYAAKVVADMGRQLDLSSSSASSASPINCNGEQIERDPVRWLYEKFMTEFPPPPNRPAVNTLLPVETVKSSNKLDVFKHNGPKHRPHRHFPSRAFFCDDTIHAIVYHPTHEYWPALHKWVTPTSIVSLAGESFDLFVNVKDCVYYVGIYTLHAMRDVHPPGSPIPPDVSPAAIELAAAVKADDEWCKIADCFPDGHIKVECFGLQCVGFDHQLYRELRQRFQAPAGESKAQKRRADSHDLRKGGYAKARPM
ncbi:hypothetical protein DFH09DRAFT_254406 [Mycena vulgaris]|nr:hypothetical protein DFH09DRAFT_254406 [Mycena vulgaris]